MGFADVLPFLGAGFDFVGTMLNYWNQQSAMKLNQANLEKAWQRDDNAMQRRLADARAAGFSPNAALSGSAGNTNPMTLTPPQVDFSGFSQSIANGPTINANRKLAEKQTNLAQTQLEAQQAELEHKKDMYIHELANSDLQAAEIIGRLLDAEIITKDDIPDVYKSINAQKDKNLGRNRQIEKDKIDATNAATKVAADRLQAEKDEREWQHNAETKTHSTTNEITYKVGDFTYHLSVTDSTTSQETAVAAGVTPGTEATYSSASKSFSNTPYIEDSAAVFTNRRDLYYVGHSVDNGLPCYSYNNEQWYVAVPSKYGISYYKIKKSKIAPVYKTYQNAANKFPAKDYKALLEKYYNESKDE